MSILLCLARNTSIKNVLVWGMQYRPTYSLVCRTQRSAKGIGSFRYVSSVVVRLNGQPFAKAFQRVSSLRRHEVHTDTDNWDYMLYHPSLFHWVKRVLFGFLVDVRGPSRSSDWFASVCRTLSGIAVASLVTWGWYNVLLLFCESKKKSKFISGSMATHVLRPWILPYTYKRHDLLFNFCNRRIHFYSHNYIALRLDFLSTTVSPVPVYGWYRYKVSCINCIR